MVLCFLPGGDTEPSPVCLFLVPSTSWSSVPVGIVLQSESREDHIGVEHGDDHIFYQDHEECFEGDAEYIALPADLVDGRAGGDDVVRADEIAQGSRGILAGEDRSG